MLDNTLMRRLVTIPLLYVTLVAATLLAPALLVVALMVDLIRRVRTGSPFMATRILAFGWVYLVGEAWALLAMAMIGLLGRDRSLELTFTLQRWWAAWNFWALRFFFSLRFEVTGSDAILPGPFLLLSRHASIIDTLLPALYVVRPFDIKLRYILKKELLLDPAIDIGGRRLPNHFVDRGASNSESERRAITRLAEGLTADEAVLIFPEGTRFTEQKRIRFTNRLKEKPGNVGQIAGRLRRVLPPKPGGTLALLEASDADVVVLMHRGLEGFARIKDIWMGALVGSTIFIQFRRVARTAVPEGRTQRIDWLFDLWASVDDWVVGEESPKGDEYGA